MPSPLISEEPPSSFRDVTADDRQESLLIAGATPRAPDPLGLGSAFESSRIDRSLSVSRRNAQSAADVEGSPLRVENQRDLEPGTGFNGRNSEILRQNCARSGNRLINTLRKYDDRTVNY